MVDGSATSKSAPGATALARIPFSASNWNSIDCVALCFGLLEARRKMQSRNYLVIAIAALIVVVLLAYAYRGSEVSTVAPTEGPQQEQTQPPADTKPGQ